MPILFRWIFYGCLGRVVATMAALLAIYVIIEAFDKSRYLGNGLTFSLLAEYLVLRTPFMIGEFLPVILLIGASVYLTELSHHQELAAMRAAGLGTSKLLLPLMSVALVAALLSFSLSEWITPATNQRADTIEKVRILKQQPVAQGVQWLKEKNRFFRLTPLDPQSFSLLLLETGPDGRWQRRIDAARATYRDGHWTLRDVHISRPDAVEGLQLSHQKQLLLDSEVSPQTAAPPSPRHMRLFDLYQYTKNLTEAGLDAGIFVFTLHNKLAAPLACLIMVLFAMALCMNMGSRISATSWGIIGAITLGLLFYVFSNASYLLASGESLPPAYAAWLPTLMFGGLASFLLLHKEGK